jgi:hypothetical protein
MTIDARFWSRVAVRQPSDCWEWTGCRTALGYGRFGIGKRVVKAHRRAWELVNGAIPDGLWVLHKCDNPPCVNPSHLWLGTDAENQHDMSAKGRNHNTRKSRCPKGHEYSAENTLTTVRGTRVCRTCKREANRLFKQQTRAGLRQLEPQE